jgi:hypothetical protein
LKELLWQRKNFQSIDITTVLKKTVTILLLIVYLLNLTGYPVLFDYFIDRTDKQMVETLDSGEYNDAALIEIKVPVNMPYSRNQAEYERWDGEIELNGIHYNYVKRKLYNDTLYLFCIPNISKTQLNNAKTAYAGSISDVTDSGSDKKQPNPFAKKLSFENEYDQLTTEYLTFMAVDFLNHHSVLTHDLSNHFIDSLEQPPDILC